MPLIIKWSISVIWDLILGNFWVNLSKSQDLAKKKMYIRNQLTIFECCSPKWGEVIVTISWRGNKIGNSALYPEEKALYADIIIVIIIIT